jgi:hypothetical protein
MDSDGQLRELVERGAGPATPAEPTLARALRAARRRIALRTVFSFLLGRVWLALARLLAPAAARLHRSLRQS